MKFIVRAFLILGGLAYFFSPNSSLDWYWFFIIIFASVVLPELLFRNKSRKQPTKTLKVEKQQPKAVKSPKKLKTDIEILQTSLEEMDGIEFERLVALYFEAKGYRPKRVGGAGDHEVDIILTDPKENYRIAVQCKHWRTKKVGNNVILRLSSGKRVHKCLMAWCITTNYYTKAAEEAAEAHKVELWNGLHVHSKIVKWQQEQLKKVAS